MRFVCTRCHRWIQKKIWRRQGDIWMRPDQFLSAWIFPNLDRLHNRRWQSCMSGKGTLVFLFFLVLVIYFLFNLIILSGQLLPYSLFQCLLESPFTIQFWMADDLFGGHTHIPHIDSDERDSDNTYRF